MARARKNGTTIGDVATEAGVSRATVSRVMNGASSVDPAIAERVRAAAEKLHYRPSTLARSLSLGTTGSIAVSVPDLEDPWIRQLLTRLNSAAETDGYHLLISITGRPPTGEAQHSLQARTRCDGLILVRPAMDEPTLQGTLEAATPAVAVIPNSHQSPAADPTTLAAGAWSALHAQLHGKPPSPSAGIVLATAI
ncbi:LacI family DNA-binding transcriptional regulator [Nesterenkonia alba]|uniref:LacI family DNA-binding transcriptional regulator n=1 Tax=Nesterenkonia alba TaxID=515814 RepID=UPI0003B645C2|nr:LacI family DNA-binding transcriptional regulator [Nesterenkonia alba]